MGLVAEGQIRDAVNRHGKDHTQYLAALLAEQQKTNHLLAQLLQALGSPQAAPQTPSWGRG